MNQTTLKENNMEWISVKDRLPEKEDDVLAYEFRGDISISYISGNDWRNLESGWILDESHVTHWMPLPEPPKEQ
jgi:hypothetical protein